MQKVISLIRGIHASQGKPRTKVRLNPLSCGLMVRFFVSKEMNKHHSCTIQDLPPTSSVTPTSAQKHVDNKPFGWNYSCYHYQNIRRKGNKQTMKENYIKRLKMVSLSLIACSVLASCASMTPTKERSEGYRIYDLKQVSSLSTLAKSLKMSLQKNSDKAVFTNNIPPHPLPEEPGRFQVVNPFANSNLGALMAAQGGGPRVPKCENSPFTGMTQDNFDGSENTTFFVCLQPYKEGYHMDIYYTFTKVSGGFSAEALGKALAQSVAGDSSQFIPRTIADLEKAAQSSGAKIKLVESYPN